MAVSPIMTLAPLASFTSPLTAASSAMDTGPGWEQPGVPAGSLDLGPDLGDLGGVDQEALRGFEDIQNLPVSAVDAFFGADNNPGTLDEEMPRGPGNHEPPGALDTGLQPSWQNEASDGEGNTIEPLANTIDPDPKDPDGIESLAPSPRPQEGMNTLESERGGYRQIENTTIGSDGQVRTTEILLFDHSGRQRGEILYNGEGQLVFSIVNDQDGDVLSQRRGPGWVEQPNENVDGPMDWRGLTPGRDETNDNGPKGPLVNPADFDDVQIVYQTPNAFYRRLWATDPDENALSGPDNGDGGRNTSDFMQPPSGGPGGPGPG